MLVVRGARQNNLKNITVELPTGRMSVITGVSGSGKSSLAFDTIYAEGYRRYMDSLSIQARSFMEQLPRPDVDTIEGLAPAVAISQRITRPSPRATVATVSEVAAYLRLLFAYEGTPYCPKCGRELRAMSRSAIVDYITSLPEKAKVILMAPLVRDRQGTHEEVIRAYTREGFVRMRIDGKYLEAGESLSLDGTKAHSIEGVIDRIVVRSGIRERVADSVETALRLGSGVIMLDITREGAGSELEYLGERAACPRCQIALPEITPRLFSSNSMTGMCPDCDGLGIAGDSLAGGIVTAPELSAFDGALGPLNGPDGKLRPRYLAVLRKFLKMFHIEPETPLGIYPSEALNALLFGVEAGAGLASPFEGVVAFLRERGVRPKAHDTDVCASCKGSGLRSEALTVKLSGKNIAEICALECRDCVAFFACLNVRREALLPVLREISGRLEYIEGVGLGYLTLDRRADTLSGGELQRLRLATQIGSRLSGVVYVLDEPTIGLHASDTRKLLAALSGFLDRGNTVIAVEHDAEVIRSADFILELGPGAGSHGGEVTFAGTIDQCLLAATSKTGAYLSGKKRIERAAAQYGGVLGSIEIRGAREHNLRGVDVDIPAGRLTCIAGPSGAGKSTLAVDVLLRAAEARLGDADIPGCLDSLILPPGITSCSMVDSTPLRRSYRTNVTTYLGIAQHIRQVFSASPEAKMRGWGASKFSPNVRGGRCESCSGTGLRKLEMQFLPDVYAMCEDCEGSGFNREVLEVRFKGMNFAQIMNMEVEEAERFFMNISAIRKPLRLLKEIGLGYLKVGQSATTFSGGEAQRVKLAAGLIKNKGGGGLYILDEPTIGLHFEDVERLLVVLVKLVEHGNTVVVVEHDAEFIARCDYVIELGPAGGRDGGLLISAGRPEDIAAQGTLTGREIAKHL
ncbi:MAG: excinuclease ABC subunit UvrA [Candidatus Brocadiia bacterium]